jgi:NAD(P)-dependent dehydrogenase (short-subunit alcohol dehydrogenase family)
VSELAGKRALVTGGSAGIGFMIARGLAAAGAEVFICSRKAEACDDAAKQIAEVGSCTALPADLSREQSWDHLAEELGPDPLHVLVNNAGAAWGATIDDYPSAAFDKVLKLNVSAVFGVTQRLLPLLRAAAGDADPARVINIGSIDGVRITDYDNFAYTASKAAAHQMTRHLAATLASERITVNAILPGPFPTKMMAHVFDDPAGREEMHQLIPLGRGGEPDDITAMANLLAGPGGRWITGALIPVDGGLNLR